MNKKQQKNQLELERLKIEFEHCEYLVKNVLWIIAIATAIMAIGVLSNTITFWQGLFAILILALILSIALIKTAKRSDDITSKDIPNLIKKL